MNEPSPCGTGVAGAARPETPLGASGEDPRELLEDLADAELARQALTEPGESVPWAEVKAEAGL
jgi:hypothetical protein